MERLLSTKSTDMSSTWRDLAQARLNIGSGEAQLGAKAAQHGPKMVPTWTPESKKNRLEIGPKTDVKFEHILVSILDRFCSDSTQIDFRFGSGTSKNAPDTSQNQISTKSHPFRIAWRFLVCYRSQRLPRTQLFSGRFVD